MLERVMREAARTCSRSPSQLRAKIPEPPEDEVVDHLPGIVDHITRELELGARGDLVDPGEIRRVAPSMAVSGSSSESTLPGGQRLRPGVRRHC